MKNTALSFAGAGVLAGIIYYSTRKKLSFAGFRQSKTKPNILFIGDSITADPKWSYPALLKKMRPDVNIDVLAKSGQTTSWMLSNLPAWLSKKYDKIFVYGGVNDALSYQTKTTKALSNVQEMINLSRANGANVYVILGYEPEKFMDIRKMPITRYIKSSKEYVPFVTRYKEIQNLYWKNLRNATIISKINLSTLTSDGIHPNGSGQQKIADTINWYI